jgi:hypothetical protein
MHPKIRKFWEDQGYQVFIFGTTSYGWMWRSKNNLDPVTLVAKIWYNMAPQYYLSDYDGPYTEKQMLRILKLQIFT